MRDARAVRWLVLSVVLSLVLTVLLNVALRLFPGAAFRAPRPEVEGGQRIRVFVPWKAMILVSVLLTILLNLLLWMT